MAITNAMLIAQKTFDLIADGTIRAGEEIHTFQKWKELGFSVKKGEHAVAKFPIWKMGMKKDDDGEMKSTGHCFGKMSFFFSSEQVEPIKARA